MQARHRVAARDVADFVADDALDLSGVFSGDQKACVQVDPLPVGDIGVEGRIIQNDDLDIFRHQARHFEDRVGPLAQGILNLGVADGALR